jgi:uncharacterized protein YlxP (DUF503 family)
MIIGACRARLYLPGCSSLKEKRSRLKPLLARLPKEFNVAVAEVAFHDVWQSAEIGLVTVVNGDPGRAHAQLEAMLRWIERHALDVEVVDAPIEIL